MDPEVLMNMESMHRRLPGAALLLLPLVAFALLWSGSLPAQVPVDEDGNPLEALDEATEPGAVTTPLEGEEAPPLTQEELETLVGPIALYPDKLLAIVLPASTYPLEIVQAARFLEQLEEDSSLKPDESWDDSVTALLNYPEVVKMMNDDIDWTWRLGEAVVRQQAEVVAAVEAFRDRAYAAGNLKSDERQTVSNNGGAIEIEPIEEDVIYVPYYEPERVVYYQPRQVYYYYPRPYPVYYYPYPSHHSFLAGYFWGVTTAFHIGWATDHLHVFHHSYWGHPYYGRQYFGHYYRRPSITVYNTYYANSHRNRSHDHHRLGDYWQPRDGGARPGHYRARLERSRDNPRTGTAEGFRVPQRDSAAGTRNRAGFRGDAGNTARSDNDVREGFAASGDTRSRNSADRTRLAGRAAAGNTNDDNDTIRFRPRERSAVPTRPEQSRTADATVRVPERNGTARLNERRNSDDSIRFRPRDRDTVATRPDTAAASSGASRNAAPARVTERPRGNERTAVRDRTRAAAVPAARRAPSNSGFRSSPGRSAPAASPNVSRPQASPRTAPRMSAPAPRPSAGTPARAPTASSAPPRQTREAPRSGSGRSGTRTSRTREH
jgi:hypothetical protein